MGLRDKLVITLFGAGTGWNMGNIGPIVTPISEEFSVSLTAVGLLSGGVLFSALLTATATAPSLMKRIGAANGARAVCGSIGLGNVVLAAAPVFGVALGARALIGYGAGLASMFDEVQRLFPERPISALSFAQIGSNGAPAALTPLVGALLAAGLPEVAWLMLAAIAAAAGLLNMRPGVAAPDAVVPVTPSSS